jgi:hypothetical protein
VTVSLLRGSDHAGVVEVLYIYSGLTSALEHAFIIDDFLEVTATITIEDGEQEIPISNLQMPLVVEQGGSVVLTVPTASGFGTVTWYVDAIAAGNTATLTLPASYTVGTHTISVTAKKNGNLYSRSFTFTVTAAGGGEVPESPGEGENGGSDTGDESGELTSAVSLLQTQSNTSGTDISSGISGTGAAQTVSLSVVEEPAVFFAIEKTAAQTITVGGADAAKVTQITDSSLDGSTASATFNLFSVNMEDLLFNGAFGSETNGDTIPTGTETRTFTLTVAEPSHTSRVITMTLGLSLDTDTETTIYHREGKPGSYYYEKVRDAELTDADANNLADVFNSRPALSAMDTGPVKDLQNAFMWVHRHGLTGTNAGAAGFAAGTTEGYSEYRLFLKKSQKIGKHNLAFINSLPNYNESNQTYDSDQRTYMSVELYGAGSPGGREQKITRNDSFAVTPLTQYSPDYLTSLDQMGWIGLTKSSVLGLTESEGSQKHKALVLGKNITIAGNEGEPEKIVFQSPGGMWWTLRASAFVHLTDNAMLIMRDHAKITNFYTETECAPITLNGKNAKFYMYGGEISGNTIGTSTSVIKKGSSGVDVIIEFKGGTIKDNVNKEGGSTNGVPN